MIVESPSITPNVSISVFVSQHCVVKIKTLWDSQEPPVLLLPPITHYSSAHVTRSSNQYLTLVKWTWNQALLFSLSASPSPSLLFSVSLHSTWQSAGPQLQPRSLCCCQDWWPAWSRISALASLSLVSDSRGCTRMCCPPSVRVVNPAPTWWSVGTGSRWRTPQILRESHLSGSWRSAPVALWPSR